MEEHQKQIDELKAMISSNGKTDVALIDASLQQNIPNPFNKQTTIRYSLPGKFNSARVVIADNNGKILKLQNITSSGKGTININAGSLAAGTYNYSLIVDRKVISSKQMILTK